jgi:hypothetical protein
VSPLERLRRICRALPGTSEKVSHGEPTFWVGGRMFATFDNHHHGAPHVGVWLAMPLGVQQILVREDPQRFFVPPYVGVRGWVGVRLDARPSWKRVEQVVREAHAFIGAGRQRSTTRPPSERATPPGRRR